MTLRKCRDKDYIKHLFGREIDGYTQIMQINKTGVVFIKNYKDINNTNLFKIYKGKKDIFISVNTSYNGKRGISNIRQLRALYLDLDCLDIEINDLIYKVWDLANEEMIPEPTMVTSSGRGIHIYWRIKHAPFQALTTWQELEDYLYYKLKYLGADKQATDAARSLRFPGTINSRNGEECKVVFINNRIIYSMYDLREKYLGWKPKVFKKIKVKENKKEFKLLQFFTSYTLHTARAEDILTLCRLRNYNVTGYRNMLLHCYAYWIGVTTREDKKLEEKVNELNDKFTEPLKKTEINAILRCVPKAIDKFLNYEQGLRCGEVKRVSNGMRDKGGYWYKNETLIERLDITIMEQKYLKTIIGTEIKYDRRRVRDNESKKVKRRNEEGLTKREQEVQVLKNKVLELKEQGLSNIQISKILGKNKSTIGRILK